MGQYDERAFVLDAKDYRESSSLVRFFTEKEGRISLIARGVKKPGKSSSSGVATIQPFNLVRVRFFLKDGATLGNMASADLERVNTAPRNSIEAYALISYWFEILKETSQSRAAAEDIFRLTARMLQDQEPARGLSLTWIAQLSEFCQHLGFGIVWNSCILCGRQSSVASQFSISKGGVICSVCSQFEHQGLVLQPDETAVIGRLADVNAANSQNAPPGTALLSLLTLLNRYLTYHLEHPLKTFSFVDATLRG